MNRTTRIARWLPLLQVGALLVLTWRAWDRDLAGTLLGAAAVVVALATLECRRRYEEDRLGVEIEKWHARWMEEHRNFTNFIREDNERRLRDR